MPVIRVDPLGAEGYPVVYAGTVVRHFGVSDVPAPADGPAARMALGRALYDLVGVDGVDDDVLLDIRPPELRLLPWELMIMPDGTRPFVTRRWARGEPAEDPCDPFLVPVRMLIAVGDARDQDLQAWEEVDEIRRALGGHPGMWHVEVLVEPTPQELFERIGQLQPHVFHFIGHSGFDHVEGLPTLEFNTDGDLGGDTEGVTADDVLNSIDHPPLLVFLNACRTTGGDGARLWDLAGAFERRGAAAVVTMRGDMPSEPAKEFARTFYRALASGTLIVEAVRLARQRLFHMKNKWPQWDLPVLLLRRPPADVLPFRLGASPKPARELAIGWYDTVITSVDRSDERWQVWGAPGAEVPPYRALVVEGATGIGKTTLLRSCVYTWHLRGRPAVYADAEAIADHRAVEWIDLVRKIAAGLEAFAPDLVADFHRVHGGPWDQTADPSGEQVFTGLRHLLVKIAEVRPLVVALDHLSRIPDAAEVFVPGLLLPIVREEVPNVSVIVAHADLDAARVLGDFYHRAEKLTVGHWHWKQAEDIFRDYGARFDRRYAGGWRDSANTIITNHGIFPPPLLQMVHFMYPESSR